MVASITLTSSMRSNLSSLKSLASQMSTTQTRLSTGKKVNNAIDNANSYYQARALTNRASDLDMLLDSMGQSIQTVTASVHGLEKSAEMLENAAVIAQQAYEAAIIPEKAWFEAQVGPNGAVVSTAQELYAALVDNDIDNIYVYNDLFINSRINLTSGKKLQGINSDITLNFNTSGVAITMADSAEIGNITINANNKVTQGGNIIGNTSIITSWKSEYSAVCYNTKVHDAKLIVSAANAIGLDSCNIYDSELSSSTGSYGLRGCNVYNSMLNIQKNGNNAWNAVMSSSIYDSIANVYTTGNNSYGWNAAHVANSQLNIYCAGASANSLVCNNIQNSVIKAVNMMGTSVPTQYIHDDSTFYLANNGSPYLTLYGGTETIDRNEFVNQLRENITSSFERGLSWAEGLNPYTKYIDSYDIMMTAYDDMVADSSYQGVNLLKGGKLTTMFNEDRTHSYTINGKDMSLSGLGITTREWQTKDDIAASIKEIQNAMSSIRDEVARLGNNLSIIETRMNFTDGLVDVLQTGADDLVLADMNEESANYLALQTRNNLAVNALALAAQSNNAVLKLF